MVIDRFIKIFLVLIVLLSVFLFYSHIHADIKDATTLSLKAAGSLESAKSYRFVITSNLSILNEDLQVMKVEGQMDPVNNRICQSMEYANGSAEVVIVGDQLYLREDNGSWQVRQFEGMETWKDSISQQSSILYNAKNPTMYRDGDDYILEIIPEKEEILDQMQSMGLETSGTDLKSYIIRYRIDADTFHIRKIETLVDVEINFMGMRTPVRLENVILLSDYNEKVTIKAPI